MMQSLSPEQAQALTRLKQWLRRRSLRRRWVEMIADLRGYKAMMDVMRQQRELRVDAATVIQMIWLTSLRGKKMKDVMRRQEELRTDAATAIQMIWITKLRARVAVRHARASLHGEPQAVLDEAATRLANFSPEQARERRKTKVLQQQEELREDAATAIQMIWLTSLRGRKMMGILRRQEELRTDAATTIQMIWLTALRARVAAKHAHAALFQEASAVTDEKAERLLATSASLASQSKEHVAYAVAWPWSFETASAVEVSQVLVNNSGTGEWPWSDDTQVELQAISDELQVDESQSAWDKVIDEFARLKRSEEQVEGPAEGEDITSSRRPSEGQVYATGAGSAASEAVDASAPPSSSPTSRSPPHPAPPRPALPHLDNGSLARWEEEREVAHGEEEREVAHARRMSAVAEALSRAADEV